MDWNFGPPMHRVELKRDFRAPYAKILKNRTLDKRGVAAVIEERVHSDFRDWLGFMV